jgi:hypothetical protein
MNLSTLTYGQLSVGDQFTIHDELSNVRSNYLVLEITSKTRNVRGYYEELLILKCWDSILKRVHQLKATADSTVDESYDTSMDSSMDTVIIKLKVTNYIPAYNVQAAET